MTYLWFAALLVVPLRLVWKLPIRQFEYVICAAGITLLALVDLVRIDLSKSGWDMQVMCAAVKTYLNHDNPYLTDNLQQYTQYKLSFPYPILVMPLLKSACANDPQYYLILLVTMYAALMIIAGMGARHNLWFLLCLMIAGFKNTQWLVYTRNIALLEMVIYFISSLFIYKRWGRWGNCFLGAAAFLKIFPLIFCLLKSICDKNKLQTLAQTLGIFFILHIISYLLAPELFDSYVRIVAGFSNGHAPIKEVFRGGISNPNLLSLSHNLLAPFISNKAAWVVGGLVYLMAVLSLGRIWLHFRRLHLSHNDIFSLGVLFIMIISPRMKPYSFFFAIPPVFFLTEEWSLKNKLWIIVLCCVFPVCAGIAALGLHGNYWLGLYAEYGQLYALIGCFVWIGLRKRIDYE